MRPTFTGVAGIFALLILAAAAQGQPRNPREALVENHPGVRFREVNGHVRMIYGVPMTSGKTADEAAEAWFGLYGEIFSGEREPGGPDLRSTGRVELIGGRTVYTFKQFVDGVEVEGATARLMVVESEEPAVAYVAGNLAVRPAGGLPDPKVSAMEALAAAQKHEAGKGLGSWSEPDLACTIEAKTRDAMLVWVCIGVGGTDSRTFYVDAVSGVVVDWFSNVSHARDITGTVTAKVSPGTKPDSARDGCVNAPSVAPLSDALVVAKNGGGTVIATDFTDDNGDYSLAVSNSTTVTVHTFPFYTGWVIHTVDGDLLGNGGLFPCPTRQTGVTDSTLTTAPASDVDLSLNDSPAQFTTAQVNTHHFMSETWDYLRDRMVVPVEPPFIDVEVNIDIFGICNARYTSDGGGCNGGDPMLQFGQAETGCVNSTYSTFVAHEYGHFLLDELLGVPNQSLRNGFHEGFSDCMGFLVFDTEIFAEDYTACSGHGRVPLDEDPQFPTLSTDPMCSSDAHIRGLLLGALWIELVNDLGTSDARDLHVIWCFLTFAPEDIGPCAAGRDQSANEEVLVQILEADDDDANLGNGTPNIDAICAIFDARGITADECPESAGRCYADCDRSRGIDVFDFLCFQNKYEAGARYACDCNVTSGTGVCDVFDFLCFQAKFQKGCR